MEGGNIARLGGKDVRIFGTLSGGIVNLPIKVQNDGTNLGKIVATIE